MLKNLSFWMLMIFVGAMASCQTSMRDMKYSAYEMVGIEKRDLFEKDLKQVRKDQDHAKEQFSDALERLRKIYKVDAEGLEKTYDQLKIDYDNCDRSAERVRAGVSELEKVARDLFAEWKGEIKEIKTPALKTHSEAELDKAQSQYEPMIVNLRKSRDSLKPVLSSFHDHILSLKHNLNAHAIEAIHRESLRIEKDIEVLISRMKSSIDEADKMIESMEK